MSKAPPRRTPAAQPGSAATDRSNAPTSAAGPVGTSTEAASDDIPANGAAPAGDRAKDAAHRATSPSAGRVLVPQPPSGNDADLPPTLLDDSEPRQPGTQTLLRGLAILEAAAAGARDLRAFGAVLGTTRSTTHRLVSSLVQARYLRQVPAGYLLGPKLIELGTIALEQMPLTAVAHPHLEALAEHTRDTIHLGVRDGNDVLYIDKIPGLRGLDMRSRIGHRMPLASTGIGRALMLDLTPQAWHTLYEAARQTLANVSFKPDLIPDLDTFMKRMTAYAAGGYTFDLEENEISIRCVAAPIRDATGMIVAGLSVASMIPYMSLERMDELIPVVHCSARAISHELGWRAPQPATRKIRRR
jgi:DNA-binding IclR family transcriptional regulator